MDVHLKELFTRYHELFTLGPGLGSSSATCLLDVEGIEPAFISAIFRASAALRRSNPWRLLRSTHLFGVRIGKDLDWSSKKQPFPCAQFVGGDGGDISLNLFRSEQDALTMSRGGEAARPPNLEVLRVTFEKKTMLIPANKRMITSLSLEPSGDGLFPVVHVVRCTGGSGGGDLRFRNPTLEELRYAFAAIKAFALVHPLLQICNGRKGRLARFKTLIETVDVDWPPQLGLGICSDLVAVTISHPPRTDLRPSDQVKKEGAAAWRMCGMCGEGVEGERGAACGRCNAVVYCGDLCRKQHWKDSHKSVCGLYRAMMEREEELVMGFFTFSRRLDDPCEWLEDAGLHRKGMWRRLCGCSSHHPFGLLPTAPNPWGDLLAGEYPGDIPLRDGGSPSPKLLSGWSEYYNLRSLPMSSPVAAILSHPLTVYHILTTLAIGSKNHLARGREVVVHYIGPGLELDWMPAFAEIGHLLKASGSVWILMVGAEIPRNLSRTSLQLGEGRVKVSLIGGLYRDRAADLPPPQVVVGLNCGFGDDDRWGSALEAIRSMNVPAFFTEQSELESSDAKQVLRAAGLHITHPVTPNPFRSPLRRQAPAINLPAFGNGFVFGVNT